MNRRIILSIILIFVSLPVLILTGCKNEIINKDDITDTGGNINIPAGLVAKWYIKQEWANEGNDILKMFEIKANGEMVDISTTRNLSVSGNTITATIQSAGITIPLGTATFEQTGSQLKFFVAKNDEMNIFMAYGDFEPPEFIVWNPLPLYKKNN